MKILENTYPEVNGIAHAKIGDEVYWELFRGAYRLRRKNIDGKIDTVFSTSEVDKDGNLRSSRKPPILIGIIAHVKSKGWIMRVG